MRFSNFIIVQLTLSLIAGIVVGFYFDIPPQGPLWGLFLLLPLLYKAYQQPSRPRFPYFEAGALLAMMLLGIFSIGMACSTPVPHPYADKNATAEHVWHLKIHEVLKPNPYAQQYIAKVKAVDEQKTPGKILLSLAEAPTDIPLKVDDELRVVSTAKGITPPVNPHQFNYQDYLKKQGISHQIRTNFRCIQLLKDPPSTLKGSASRLQAYLIAHLQGTTFGKEELGVLQALLLGERNSISEPVYTAYKDAGAVHILAVSGLHVGILLLLLQWVLSPLERLQGGKTIKPGVLVGLLWAYAFVAGLSPSIVRAVTMFSFVAYALCLNRPTNTFNVVVLSMFFILLINPLFLFQTGFQMSYAAVFAIVWIYPKLQGFWQPRIFILRKAWQLLAISFAAQLGVLPISLFYFHQFPALFFVANLAVVPFLGLILGAGITVLLLSLLHMLPSFLMTAYNTLINSMNTVIQWVAQQEGFILRDIPFDGVQLVAGYGIILALIVFLYAPKGKNALVVLVSMLTLQGWALSRQWQLRYKERFILAHSWQNTVLLHQTGTALTVYASDTTKLKRITKEIKAAEGLHSIVFQPLEKGYKVGDASLYLMDRLGIYPSQPSPHFLLLTQSPKINLERLLDSLPPKTVLADGSNYRNSIRRWKKTCAAKGIPFYYTGEKGAFYFKL